MDESLDLPQATVVGSSNFSYRSRSRDLELCLLIETKNKELKLKLKQELDRMKEHAKRVDLDTLNCRSALWLKAASAAVFKYFL